MFGDKHGVSFPLYPGDRLGVDVVVAGKDQKIAGDLRFGCPEGIRGPELALLHDDLDRCVEPVEVPDGILLTVTDHHHDIADGVLQQGVNDVLDDRPVCDREHGFGLAPGERTETAPLPCC